MSGGEILKGVSMAAQLDGGTLTIMSNGVVMATLTGGLVGLIVVQAKQYEAMSAELDMSVGHAIDMYLHGIVLGAQQCATGVRVADQD